MTASAAQLKGAAKGRATQARKRLAAKALEREIRDLRLQVGRALSNQHVSGVNLRLGDVDEEYVPDLKRLSSRTRIFERMAQDPQVRGQLRSISSTLISGVKWEVDGGTKPMQDLVRANLLGKGDPRLRCSSSWLDFLYESLGCLIYGFSLFGKTRAVVGDRMIFQHLTWMHPRSVDEDGWRTDDRDNLLEIRRSYRAGDGTTYSADPLPISEAFLLTWDRRGPNFEGNAFIRPMYRPFILNEMAEKIDIIDLQNRGVGIPVAKLSGSGGKKERDTLVEILKSLRGGSKERAFVVLQTDEELNYLLSEGQSKDAAPILQHHRANIAKTAGGEWFDQGNTSTGSRAGASALATGFFINVDAIKMILLDMINSGISRLPGIVQELVDMNFDNVREYPAITGSRVSPTEQLDNIPLVQDSVQKGVIPPHRKLANEVLRRLGYPEMTEEEWEEAMKNRTSVMVPGGGGGAGRPSEAGDDDRGRDDEDGNRLRMASEKKTTFSESPRTRRQQSWPWLTSTPA